MTIYLRVLLLLLVVCCEQTYVQESLVQEKINWLQARLNRHYWKRDQKYVFPITWEHQKGIFESKVHFNYVGKHNLKFSRFMRDKEGVQDINMFVTSFALYGLLEAKQLGTIKIDEHEFSQSLMAISQFRDKNIPDGIPQYVFWPQTNINGTWAAYASNLMNSCDVLPNFTPMEAAILNYLGLGVLASAKEIAKYFIIPADNDDSSVNLALLGFLKEVKSEHYSFWNSLNTRKKEYYDRALKYAYRPFGPKMEVNKYGDQIDPRTYFVLREFLDIKAAESNPSLILPTTWLLKTDQMVEGSLKMPFSANNVDASVCANFIFGLSYQILAGEMAVEKGSELEQMMLDTVDLLEHTIEVVMEKRPTLLLVYYPSKYDFYWFVARITALLRRAQLTTSLPHPLPEVKERLEKLMKTLGTSQIIKGAKKSGQTVFWAQFLGNFAGKERNEDAIFSTTLAINALFDTWTTRQGANLYFIYGTPDEVKQTIRKGVSYLMRQLKPGMLEVNAFFSGSMKYYRTTFPYFFPANNVTDDGKVIDPTNSTMRDLTAKTVVLAKGYIQKEVYDEYLTKKWFGYEVPIEEGSLNEGYGMTFPFWSAESIAEVMGITALSKYLRTFE